MSLRGHINDGIPIKSFLSVRLFSVASFLNLECLKDVYLDLFVDFYNKVKVIVKLKFPNFPSVSASYFYY